MFSWQSHAVILRMPGGKADSVPADRDALRKHAGHPEDEGFALAAVPLGMLCMTEP